MMPKNYKHSFIALSAFLFLLIVKESRSELMCYACEDCATVSDDTPTVRCDEESFNATGVGLPAQATMTTAEPSDSAATTTSSGAMSTTTAPITTKTATTEAATTKATTTQATTTKAATTTTAAATMTTTMTTMTTTSTPTAATEGDVLSSTDRAATLSTVAATGATIQLPAGESTFTRNLLDLVFPYNTTLDSDEAASTGLPRRALVPTFAPPSMNASSLRLRQERDAPENETESTLPAFYCFKAMVVANNSYRTRRGCTRVVSLEGVCEQLKTFGDLDAEIPANKCKHCNSTLCNGSSVLSVSVSSFVFVLVAVLLKQR